MAECIDCGAYVKPPEKHCDDCKVRCRHMAEGFFDLSVPVGQGVVYFMGETKMNRKVIDKSNRQKITVVYWGGVKFADCRYEHNEIFTYSVKSLHKIIHNIMLDGFNVMVINKLKSQDVVHVWIDADRFRQT